MKIKLTSVLYYPMAVQKQHTDMQNKMNTGLLWPQLVRLCVSVSSGSGLKLNNRKYSKFDRQYNEKILVWKLVKENEKNYLL